MVTLKVNEKDYSYDGDPTVPTDASVWRGDARSTRARHDRSGSSSSLPNARRQVFNRDETTTVASGAQVALASLAMGHRQP